MGSLSHRCGSVRTSAQASPRQLPGSHWSVASASKCAENPPLATRTKRASSDIRQATHSPGALRLRQPLPCLAESHLEESRQHTPPHFPHAAKQLRHSLSPAAEHAARLRDLRDKYSSPQALRSRLSFGP